MNISTYSYKSCCKRFSSQDSHLIIANFILFCLLLILFLLYISHYSSISFIGFSKYILFIESCTSFYGWLYKFSRNYYNSNLSMYNTNFLTRFIQFINTYPEDYYPVNIHDWSQDLYDYITKIYYIFSSIISFVTVLLPNFIFNNGFYSVILSTVLLLLISSFSLLFYLKEPIFESKELSLKSFFNNNKPIHFMSFISLFLSFIYVIFVFIIVFVVYITSKISNINVKKYYGIHKSISHSKLIQLSNKASLHILEPRLTNAFVSILIITVIAFVIILFIIMSISLEYSLRNNINGYNELCFIIEIIYCIFKFLVVAAPTYILMSNIISYFEKHLSYINISVALVILLLVPFMEIFYVLYTFNSLNKVDIK